jgi:hypothetical protein
MARGEVGYPEPRAKAIGNLVGAPIRDKMRTYSPLDDAANLTDCAALFIVAEREELFDNNTNAFLAYTKMPGTNKKYVAIPGISHYGIYREQREEAIRLAIAWFDQQLKAATSSR